MVSNASYWKVGRFGINNREAADIKYCSPRIFIHVDRANRTALDERRKWIG